MMQNITNEYSIQTNILVQHKYQIYFRKRYKNITVHYIFINKRILGDL